MDDYEPVVQRQREIVESIQRVEANFKKDSDARKTEEYLRTRLQALETLWEEFEKNNLKLRGAPDQTGEYFVENVFQQMRNLTDRVRTNLSNYRFGEPSTPKAKEAEQQQTSKLNELFNEQKANFRALQRLLSYIDVDKINENWELEDELRNLQTRWERIDTLHLKIDNLLLGSDKDYEERYSVYEKKYRLTKKALNQKISATTHLYKSTPQMELPNFYGDYSQWPTFLDLYKSAIHDNPLLSKAQKMQHLKGKLKGEALRLVQHLTVTAENYLTAWDLLYHRYNNHHLLFSRQIEIFLNQPTMNKQSSHDIKKLHDTTMECVHAIHNLGIDTTTWDPLLVHLLTKKLDSLTLSDYKESRKAPRDLPTLEDFTAFLEAKFIALEPISKREREPAGSSAPKQLTFRPKDTASYAPQRTSYRKPSSFNYMSNALCVLCNVNHAIYQCKTFESMSPDVKLKTVTKHGMCKNCLYVHERNVCNSTKTCKICHGKHNTLLHDAVNEHGAQESRPAFVPKQQSRQQYNWEPSANHVTNYNGEILLTTVLARVRANDNTYVTLRCLLDQGSQISLITENAAQRLGLPRRPLNGSVTGIGESIKKIKGKVQLQCKSIHSDYIFTTHALVMPKLINSLPSNSFDKPNYAHIQHLQLADPDFNISKPIDILLDAKVYSDIIMSGLVRGTDRQPIAQQTQLGWIISGNVNLSLNCNVILNNVQDIANYWEMEEISEETTATQDDKFCEQLYTATTRRLPDGKYEVRLPMKEGFEEKLGQSKAKALAQFNHLEQRLTKNCKLRDSYQKFMEEYQELGHMEECRTNQEPSCFLPHHCIQKADSTTTKLRVVFNASSRNSSGHSLNDLMECGPKLQQDIQDLLLRWRTYEIVFTADCEKMYRCILIQEDQQHLQKIVWRSHPQDFLKEYKLCTLSYGTKAAPFLALRTMAQLAVDEAEKYPLGAKVLQKDFYVDDLLSGCNSIEQARETQHQLIDMLRSAGMNLRKWASNRPQLLSDLSPNQINQCIVDIKNMTPTKALGLQWNPITDTFTFQYADKQRKTNKMTKRILLSEISKIFDPLGWISPVTIRAKLLFQKVFLTGLEWDQEVPHDTKQEWLKIQDDLHNIDKLNIPRWIGDTTKTMTVHGFCDASEKVYACVIYLTSTNDKGDVITRMVAAKTKLAPKKKALTLPRLELSSAVLLSKLMSKVLKALPHNNIPIYGWTDSLIVMGWLQGNPTRWKTFVANRIAQIIDIMPSKCWRHVSSQNNAADCATRGLSTTQLISHSLWWDGPSFIKHDIPDNVDKLKLPECELKLKPNPKTYAVLITSSVIEDLLQKYSSLSRIVRITCYVSRFITNLRHRSATYAQTARRQLDTLGIVQYKPMATNYLTTKEIDNAYNVISKAVQGQEFAKDIHDIQQKGTVNAKSTLLNLRPYLDERGVLRVGGRLQHAHLTENAKHPIILPKHSRLTDLSISQAHLQTLHGTAPLTLVALRQRFWVLSGTRMVKKYVSQCVKCFRYNTNTRKQVMGDLPEPRVTPSRPFTHTGIDFTGQVELKANKGRGIKTTRGYIEVFVCFATKAIHLELASDLTTPTFLAAFKRMCARRGVPLHVYSDNGSNFIGAARVLKQEKAEIMQIINKDLLDDIAEMGVTWHFSAPSWPSGGGIWEAAVKSTKHHLKRVLGDQKLTFEEFTTLLTQIEACLNSRPLYALTDNSETDYLSPGHFLVRGPMLSLPTNGNDTNCGRTRWQVTEKMLKSFWKRWSSEYLHPQQLRHKWQQPTKNLEKDDIVLIKEDNMPPAKWAMGRVAETHPGKDGYIRVVTLRTKGKLIQRPVIKLAPLPVQKPDQSISSDIHTKPDTAPQKVHRRARRNKQSFMTSMLLLLLTCVLPAATQILHIDKIKNNNTLYFDKISDISITQDEWKMVAFYNMTTYWDSICAIKNYTELIKRKCNDDYTCAPVIAQFEHELNELRHYNNLLTMHHKVNRQRRGVINGVGYLANMLFGVLDDKFAEKYEKDIEIIAKREDHIFNLYKNQTSILEAHNNILKRNEFIMKGQFTSIARTLHNLTEDINQAQTTSLRILNSFSVLSSMVAANVIISNLRRIQDTVLDTITDIYHGRLNVHLLPPEQIQQQLELISGHLQGDLTVPVDNIGDLYGLLHVQARVTQKFLIMEIRLPLLNRNQFELDEIIGIPRKNGNSTIYTSTGTKYIAINVKKDTVIPMTETDILACISHKNNHMLCPLNHPVYTMKVGESICDMQLMINDNNKPYCQATVKECANRWIKLHARDTWLFTYCSEHPIRVICPDGVTTQQLIGTGLVVIPSGCSVRGKSFAIHSQHDYKSQIFIQNSYLETPKISPINDVIKTSLPEEIKLLTEDHNYEFLDLSQKIKAMNEQNLEQLPRNDNTHYIVIYVILGTISLAITTLIICKLKRSCQLKLAQPDTPLQEVLSAVAPACPGRTNVQQKTAPNTDIPMTPQPRRKVSFKELGLE